MSCRACIARVAVQSLNAVCDGPPLCSSCGCRRAVVERCYPSKLRGVVSCALLATGQVWACWLAATKLTGLDPGCWRVKGQVWLPAGWRGVVVLAVVVWPVSGRVGPAVGAFTDCNIIFAYTCMEEDLPGILLRAFKRVSAGQRTPAAGLTLCSVPGVGPSTPGGSAVSERSG